MEHLLTFSLQPQGRTRCHHHPRSLCRQEVRDHLAPRQRHQVAPLPPRPRRRCRALPPEGHPPHVEEQAGQEEQGQAFRQAGQLHPHHAHPLHHRAREPEGHPHPGHIQGGLAKGGRQEDRQEGFRGAIPVRQEQVVLHTAAVLSCFPS